MKKILIPFIISMFIAVGVVGNISAELLERDLFDAGDGLITYDSSTGKEWLDVVVTGGRPWSTWNSGTDDWISVHGFTWANQYQVTELFQHAGIETIDGPGNLLEYHFFENNLSGVMNLLQLTGTFTTLSNSNGRLLYTAGYVAGQDKLGGPYASASIAWNDDYFIYEPNGGWATVWHDGSGAADWNEGAWLYRTTEPIPEPATMLLLSSGLAGLAGLGKKIRK